MADEQKHILSKAVTMTGQRREQSGGGSKQLPADPFSALYGKYGLVRPVYQLERLLELKESNPIHAACIKQKAADIAGLGWKWEPRRDKDKPDDKQKESLQDFLENCNPEMTFREMLQAGWDDWETMGWAIFEVVEDATGKPIELYHVPAHTMRAHNDGKRFAQYREGVLRWFKRIGVDEDYDLNTGREIDTSAPDEQKAGKVLVIRDANSRSSYYGIPTYISALGAIVGSLAVRDFNINFFSDGTIPDVLLIIEGADISKEVKNELTAFFSVEARGQHQKMCVLPIPAEMAGEVKVRVEKLQMDVKDASFRLYRQDNAMEICVAHRTPPYRIGWPVMGSMGGATAKEMTEIYKRSVVQPAQEILEHRINQQLFKLFVPELGEISWKFKLAEIDLTDQMSDLTYATTAIKGGIMNRNEARAHVGMEEAKDPQAETYYIESGLVPVDKAGEEPGQEPPQPGQKNPQPVQKSVDNLGIMEILGAVQGILKAAANVSEDEGEKAWKQFEKLHHKQEQSMQGKVADFFDYRQSK